MKLLCTKFFVHLQANEKDSDPLIVVENGGSLLADGAVAKEPVWNSSKDVDA